ncbi:MAG TPA: hypothetical protein VFT37_05110 [Telluria sp.]|nr:hypothetical protein [Telluria sp.]
MKTRHAILAVALVVSAALAAFGDKEPVDAVVESVERPLPARPAQAQAVRNAAQPQAATAVMRLVPRDELIGPAGDDDGAFGSQSWNPPPPEPEPAPPPPPPSAPPLPFAYIGKALGEGRLEVYLAQGERVHTVRTGDVIDGAWRVDSVAPPTLTMTYLPLGQVQHMNIGANE